MSFQYHQYVDYSNPATPRVYAWEVASATSTEQDPTMQVQQDPQTSVQQQQVSPSQLQLHQLPPPVPHQQQQLVQPQPTTPQEPQPEQPQQHHQQHQQRQPAVHYLSHPQTIHVQPTARKPQYRFETITEEDFINVDRPGSSRRRGASKPPSLHVDTRRASSSSAPTVSPSALSSAGTGTGPLRIPHSRAHTQSAHPYRRPQSRAASGSTASTPAAAGSAQAQAGGVRSSPLVSELQSGQTPQTSVGGAGGGSALPAVGSAMAVSCPAASSWREGLLGLSDTSGGRAPIRASVDPEVTPGATPRAQAHALPVELVKRYGIRTDIHYNAEENLITAMFELPGVKKTDLRIMMSVCPFSRVRQVSISGISRAVLPFQGHSVRERKFGQFFRTLAVPPETKPEDIVVGLEDGILTMKIPGGTPAQAEQPQDIPIP